MLFDSHAHLDDDKYSPDRPEVIAALCGQGTDYVMNVASDMMSSHRCIELAEAYPFIYASVGVHPGETAEMSEENIEILKQLSKHEKVKAIGEIGLDYYYPEPDREIQKKWFRRQMQLAMELDLPFIIHDRDAHEDCINILKEFDIKKTGGVMHCFSGSAEMARRIVSMGLMVALGGTVTFKNAAKTVKVAQEIPLEHIIIETDSPYLTPEPFRGKRNTPGYVKFVAQKIAEIKGIDVDMVAKITCENAKRLYRID